MQYDQLIALVAERAGLFKGDAIDLTRATLATLADRIGDGAVRELAAHCPDPRKTRYCLRRKKPKRSASRSSSIA